MKQLTEPLIDAPHSEKIHLIEKCLKSFDPLVVCVFFFEAVYKYKGISEVSWKHVSCISMSADIMYGDQFTSNENDG